MSHRSILLVDDEPNVLKSISYFLEKNNCLVTTAASGRDAMEKFLENHYDLVVTDLVMPEMDGMTVLKKVKHLSPDTGVIVLTGYANVSSAVKALKLGADDFLEKPCEMHDLLNKVKHSFEKRELIDRLRDQNELLKKEIAARKSVELKLLESQTNLERQVQKRTAELSSTVIELETVLKTLVIREKELQDKNRELHDTNTALSILLKRGDKERSDVRREIVQKTIETVLPLLKKADNHATGPAKGYLAAAQTNVLDLFSTQQPDTVLSNAKLAPREWQVVHYIRQNKSSKEIADLLDLKVSTITSYRENIRKKFRIKSKKINLKKFLTSIC